MIDGLEMFGFPYATGDDVRSSPAVADLDKNYSLELIIGSHDSHAPFTTGDPSVYDPKNIKVPTYWIDTPELREVMIQYYAEITNFDRLVGMMRKELEKRNLWNRN